MDRDMTAAVTNEEMEIEATAEKAGFSDVDELATSETKAVNVSADTYERLITYAESLSTNYQQEGQR